MTRELAVVTPTTWTNPARGTYFENLMSGVLQKLRYEVTERVRLTGVEIDLLLSHRDFDIRAFAECKFHKEPIQSGVLSNLVGNCVLRGCSKAILFTTAQLGKEAKGIIETKNHQVPELKVYTPDELYDLFCETFKLVEPHLSSINAREESIGAKHLIVLPENRFVFAYEAMRDGIPAEVYMWRSDKSFQVDQESLEYIYDTFPAWVDLARIDADQAPTVSITTTTLHETVATVGMAETFADYRPCRPQDFVGRQRLQSDILDYIEQVRSENTQTRLLCISGPSGFGKSSLLLKLKDVADSKFQKDGLIVYPIDTRSAVSPNFVSLALKQAFYEVRSKLGNSLFTTGVEIQSTSSYLGSESVGEIISDLRLRRKVLLLFFDQFEETFTKSELLETFRAFERLAYELDGAKCPIVLGFSWRTGIALPDDLPTYNSWHNWQDRRFDLKVEAFDSQEAYQMLAILQQHLGEKLDQRLKRRLMDQSSNYPWLLKKLCIHVISQANKGFTQDQVVSSALNVSELFEEDLTQCNEDEVKCLRYVATNSPIDITDLSDNFGQPCINALLSKRLIVRSGTRYSVYWDIFRDYLTSGKTPEIPNTFIPQMSVNVAYRVYRDLLRNGEIHMQDIMNSYGYSEGTATNIIGDLVSLGLASRAGIGTIRVSEGSKGIHSETLTDIARGIRLAMRDHALALALKDRFAVGEVFSIIELDELFMACFASRHFSAQVAKGYRDRLIKWMVFAGSIEQVEEGMYLRPVDIGKQAGRLGFLRLTKDGRRLVTGGEFLGATGPQNVVSLLQNLVKGETHYQSEFRDKPSRNAIQDLLGLQLAYWSDGQLLPSERAVDSVEESVYASAEKSRLVTLAREALLKTESVLDAKQAFGILFRPGASPTSVQRYFGAARTWIRAINSFKV